MHVCFFKVFYEEIMCVLKEISKVNIQKLITNLFQCVWSHNYNRKNKNNKSIS